MEASIKSVILEYPENDSVFKEMLKVSFSTNVHKKELELIYNSIKSYSMLKHHFSQEEFDKLSTNIAKSFNKFKYFDIDPNNLKMVKKKKKLIFN